MRYRLLNGWTYDSITGQCINNRGKIVDRKPRPDGYTQINVNGWQIYLHRLIYMSVHGKIKKGFVVDHYDGDRSNVKLKNLKLVPKQLNSQKRLPTTFSEHLPGVALRKSNGKFKSRITVNGRRISLGDYFTEEEAYKEYIKAKKKWHLEGAAENIEDNI